MPADLVRNLKRKLVDHILEVATQTNMVVAAHAMGSDPPRMSDLRHGRVDQFSLERLIRMLDAIGRRVRLEVEVVGPRDVDWFACARAQRKRRKRRASSAQTLRRRPGTP
jgi:predicted XRE-type DNA-binding protein